MHKFTKVLAPGCCWAYCDGLVSGFVIAHLEIAALATMQIVRSLVYIISEGKSVGIEDELF